MNDILLEEIEDLQLFADPFEQFKQFSEPDGWSAKFVRNGREIAVRRNPEGDIRILRGPEQGKTYLNLRGLLVSETFANLERLARAQKHVTEHLADPTTGEPKKYLPNNGEIRRGDETSKLTFKEVHKKLEEREDELRVFIVNGPAGIGKSHLIERIVRRRAEPKSYTSGAPLLLHVESRGKVLTSLPDRIDGTLSNLRAGFVGVQLMPLVRRGAVQVVIDGFDELSDSRGYVRAWGALKEFIRDLRGKGTCILAGRDTMLDSDTVRQALGNLVNDNSTIFLHVQHPHAKAVREWLSTREEWNGSDQLNLVEELVEKNEYLRRPLFIVQIAELGPQEFQDAQGDPIASLMDGAVRREGKKLTGVASDIEPEKASDLYRKVLSETARIMMDDETNTVETAIVRLLIEETFTGIADQEMISALAQRAGTLGLLENAGGADWRAFPHETVRSYFFAHSVFDDFPEHGATNGLHRVPLGADDFQTFNRVARRKRASEQRMLRNSLQNKLRAASIHDYLTSNIGGLLLSFAPLKDDDAEDDRLALANLELRDVWMAELLGAQKVNLDNCVVHRLDVRGADLGCVQFRRVRVFEMLVDPFVKFGASTPTVDSLILYENFKEDRWEGLPSEWIEQRKKDFPASAEPDEKWFLLEKFARISMRQHAIRQGGDDDPVARKIFKSGLWNDLKDLLVRHGRLEEGTRSAAGPASQWFHLVEGREFLNPGGDCLESTKEILRELNIGNPG